MEGACDPAAAVALSVQIVKYRRKKTPTDISVGVIFYSEIETISP